MYVQLSETVVPHVWVCVKQQTPNPAAQFPAATEFDRWVHSAVERQVPITPVVVVHEVCLNVTTLKREINLPFLSLPSSSFARGDSSLKLFDLSCDLALDLLASVEIKAKARTNMRLNVFIVSILAAGLQKGYRGGVTNGISFRFTHSCFL